MSCQKLFQCLLKNSNESTLISLNFLKSDKKLQQKTVLKIRLVFNEIYRGKENIYILLACECIYSQNCF